MQLAKTGPASLGSHRLPAELASRAGLARARLPQRASFRLAAPVRAVVDGVMDMDKVPSPAEASGAAAAATGAPAPPPAGETPGAADRRRFRLHWSVDMWRDFNPKTWVEGVTDEAAPVADRLRAFADSLGSAVSATGVLSSGQAAQYWAYSLARSGFFAAQAVAGLAAARAGQGAAAASDGPLSRWEQIARNGVQGPLAEAMLTYYQDYECIREGKFGMPWDAVTPGHRQFNPLFLLRRAALFVDEARATLARRERGAPDAVWLRSAFLPDYVQETFHYQSDGWMSSRSAEVYESSTETLFVGRQDAMQRTALVPIAEFMAGRDASQVAALEVAAGTGRFATFFKDNYPATQLTVSDVSPFYLQAARGNLKYWKRMRAQGSVLPGVDGTGVSFVQAAAEGLPFPDASFDLVYCVYLFHELPGEAAAAAAAEMARVVRPGGMVVLTDSVQLGDRSVYDATLGGFSKFNEPYYEAYLAADLGALFEGAGLVPDLKVLSSTTKSLSFRKPAAGGEGGREEGAAEQPSGAFFEPATGDPIMN